MAMQPSTPEGHEPTPLRTKQTPKCFKYLAENLGKEWQFLAVELGFRQDELERIQADYKYTMDQTFKILVTWWQQWDRHNVGGESDALDSLCDALGKSGRRDLADNIKNPKSSEGVEDFDLELCRTEFIRYYKDVMGLIPLLPWFPSEVSEIGDNYVDLKLMENKSEAARVVRREIGSYEDMLRLELQNNKPLKNILITGIAGSGKTTIVSKMANDWTLERPESPLSKFRLLVALSMRELKSTPNLTDAIFDQILPKDTKVSRIALRNYLTSHANEILVMLDGADEFDKEGSQLPVEGDVIDIISNKVLCGCTVIVTTRPHMIDKLCKRNPRFSRIECKGFSDSGVKEYIQKFFKDEDVMISSNLYQTFVASESLHSLARIPMMLLLMCLVSSDGHKLPETLTILFEEALVFMLKRHFEKSGDFNPEYDESNPMYDEIVQKLGKTALDGLMMPGQKLVFETSDFQNSKAAEESCKNGILSQERVRSKSRTMQTVTFLHKTVQEAIAGFYWASLVESQEDTFKQYLHQVNEKNALNLEYLLRFCCGANVKAARFLLTHIADIFSWEKEQNWELVDYKTFSLREINFQIVFKPQQARLNKRLWLLMHLEAQHKGLNTIAEPIFQDALTFNWNCPRDERLAFLYLIQCATDPTISQSFLTKLKQVSISFIKKDIVPVVINLLEHAVNVASVRLSFTDHVDKDCQDRLGVALSQLTLLVSLSLSGYHDGPEILDLSECFKRLNLSCPAGILKFLDLDTVGVDCTRLKKFLEKQDKLCRIAVHHYPHDGCDKYKFWSEALDGLQTQSLQVLEVSDLSTVSHTRCLSRSYPNLQVLRLTGDDLSEEDFQHVCILLSKGLQLQVVDLSRNTIGNGFTRLAEQLQKLKKLEVLKLSDMDMVSDQVVVLAKDVLPLLTNLQILSLSHYEYSEISVTPTALLSVVQWSCTSSSLKKLGIKQISMNDLDAEESVSAEHGPMAEPVQTTCQSSIETLDMSSNIFGKCTPQFIGLLKHMPVLKILDMSSMRLTYSNAVDLAMALPNCKQLQMIHMGDNDKVGIGGLEALLKMLQKLPDLKYISMPDMHGEPTDMILECLSHGDRATIITSFYEFHQSQIEAVVKVVQQNW